MTQRLKRGGKAAFAYCRGVQAESLCHYSLFGLPRVDPEGDGGYYSSMSEPAPRSKLFTPTLRFFMLAMILANLGGSMFFPFFSILLKKLGFPVETIGLYFTISAIFPLALQIIGGWVSDRIGRIKSIAIGSVAGAISWFGILAAPNTSNPVVWYLVSNAVGAITVSLVSPSFDAFIAEQSSEGNRTRVYSVIQSVYMIVGIAGPLIGGFIAERYSYEILAWASAFLYWTATAIRVGMARRVSNPHTEAAISEVGGSHSSIGVPPRHSLGEGLKGIVGLAVAGGLFSWILVADGVFDIAGKLSGDLLPLYLREVGNLKEASIGALQSASAICMALAMLPFGTFADKRGERYPIAFGAFLVAMSAALLAVGRSFPVFLVAYCFFGLGMAGAGPSIQSLISKAVPESLRGLAFGFLSTSLGLFSFLAPGLGGLLWQRFFPALPLVVSGILCVVVIPLVLVKLVVLRATKVTPADGLTAAMITITATAERLAESAAAPGAVAARDSGKDEE